MMDEYIPMFNNSWRLLADIPKIPGRPFWKIQQRCRLCKNLTMKSSGYCWNCLKQ